MKRGFSFVLVLVLCSAFFAFPDPAGLPAPFFLPALALLGALPADGVLRGLARSDMSWSSANGRCWSPPN